MESLNRNLLYLTNYVTYLGYWMAGFSVAADESYEEKSPESFPPRVRSLQ